MVIDRKRGLNVQRETWVGAKLMEGGIGWGGGRKVQYGERVDRQREKREDISALGYGKKKLLHMIPLTNLPACKHTA